MYFYSPVDTTPEMGGGTDDNSQQSQDSSTSSGQENFEPFGGNPWPIPGTIEAEDYDLGGESIGYHDHTPGNKGGQYRKDNVDIWYSEAEGYYTGANADGEWLAYSINVEKTGQYSFDVIVATPNSDQSMHAELDGVNVTGKMTIPNTGSWHDWQTVMSTVTLSKGRHVLKVVFDQGGFDFNRISINFIGGEAAEDTIEATQTATSPQKSIKEYAGGSALVNLTVLEGNENHSETSSPANNVASISLQDNQYLRAESSEGSTITNFEILDVLPSSLDTSLNDLDFRYGLIDFSIEGVDINGCACLKLYFPENSTPEAYYKYGPTPDDAENHWYEFAYDGETGAQIEENVVTLHFIDNKRGDDNLLTPDNKISGSIGGVVFRSSQATQGDDDTSATINNENNSGCFLQCVYI